MIVLLGLVRPHHGHDQCLAQWTDVLQVADWLRRWQLILELQMLRV
jgi:hypothetical protein